MLTDDYRFIFASMQSDRIVSCTTLGDVYDLLNLFPQDMDAFYEEAWERATSDLTSPRAMRARSILVWATLAETCLTMEALEEALRASGLASDQEPLTGEEILSSCAGLIRIEPEVSSIESAEYHYPGSMNPWIIALVHPSAHRHLMKNRDTYFPNGHDEIVSACLRASGAGEIMFALPFYSFWTTE